MKFFCRLGSAFLVAPILLAAGQSQNETFIEEEIQKVPICGVSIHSLTDSHMLCY